MNVKINIYLFYHERVLKDLDPKLPVPWALTDVPFPGNFFTSHIANNFPSLGTFSSTENGH